ncbi:hypothetical protein GQ457_13G008390 [Hibiscus cannabinus]
MCRTKENGGLGWFEISTRNRSLLNNCIWRFGSKGGSLWRRVVDAKYDLDNISLLPIQSDDVPSLKSSFPRIFGLVVHKSGKVCEFGSKVGVSGSGLVESFVVRRALFSWEFEA